MRQRAQHGFVLIALIALLVMGALAFLVSNLSPEFMQAYRQRQTDAALMQAREALIGYALQYRDKEASQGRPDRMYGYLPLPDLGSSRNNNSGCGIGLEGCDAAYFLGNFFDANGIGPTVVGRFPWRTLGTGPLRDSNGECLWLIVSSLHNRIQQSPPPVLPLPPMNWDTLGQLDIVVANGTAAMQSTLASAHERPIAIIFSPGPPLPGQNRSNSVTDTVSECGGNYNPANYLDPNLTSTLRDYNGVVSTASAYFSGSTSTDTATTNLAISIQGMVQQSSGNSLWQGNCPSGANCAIAANDKGLTLTTDALFGAIRKNANFRTDINSMLDRMVGCLRDQIAAGINVTPDAISGFTSPGDKQAGRIPDNDIDNDGVDNSIDPDFPLGGNPTAYECYDDSQNPLGYFNHWRDQIFLVTKNGSDFNVTTDGLAQSCPAALFFANQRGTKSPTPTDAQESLIQLRTAAAVSGSNLVKNTDWLANYLEDDNLSHFTGMGLGFTGAGLLDRAPPQAIRQDIVRCIPGTASIAVNAPTVSASAGNIRLASYSPGARLLTLGSANISSNYGASAARLFACAWTPEIHAGGTGFRQYFRFRIRRRGEGFTFAVIDGDRNGSNVCGAARQHLGYSGDNGTTPYIQWPKLAIEFDASRNTDSGNAAFNETGTPPDSIGRNDPCYLSSCGATQNLASNAHVAVVYWGYDAANATVTQPKQDDNVHGFPWPPDTSARPAPRNPYPILPYPTPAPDPAPGVAPLDRMGVTDASQRDFHARLEVTRSFTAPSDAKNGATGIQVKLWIEPQPAASISAMTYNAGSPPTLTVTTSTSHGLNTGDIVVIKDAVPSGFNGEYPITRIDANHFTATLPNVTANPGPYISAITWTDSPDFATVTSPNHGLNSGDSITITGAIPPEYNGPHVITKIDNDSYRFILPLSYDPGDMVLAIAATKALTPHAIALANTTRPMSQLDATFKPLVSDTATIYDEQKGACAVSAPRCPSDQSCGSDNMCYRPSFRNLRLGFTLAERLSSSTSARGQLIEISDQALTWLP